MQIGTSTLNEHQCREIAMASCEQTMVSLLEAAKQAVALGLNRGSSGNLSVRDPEHRGIWITPGGIASVELTPDDLVLIDLQGRRLEGRCQPSSEWPMHTALYQTRPDFNAVIHTHSTHASAWSCTRKPIPAFHYMVLASGMKQIPCAEYAVFGSQQLADNAVQAMAGGKACLLANHGVLCAGSHLGSALDLAVEMESLAEQYMRVRETGELVLLSDKQMEEAWKMFQGYASPPRPAGVR